MAIGLLRKIAIIAMIVRTKLTSSAHPIPYNL